MDELQVFVNQDFGRILTIMKDGEILFVAKDVCIALGIENMSQALSKIDEDDRFTTLISNGIEGTVVSEHGLYALILGSRKPEAKAFKRWITHEVLPSIRKHETYTTGNFLDDALHDPDMMIRMLRELKQEREKRLLAEEREQRTDDAIQDAFRKGFEWIYRPIIECNGKR